MKNVIAKVLEPIGNLLVEHVPPLQVVCVIPERFHCGQTLHFDANPAAQHRNDHGTVSALQSVIR